MGGCVSSRLSIAPSDHMFSSSDMSVHPLNGGKDAVVVKSASVSSTDGSLALLGATLESVRQQLEALKKENEQLRQAQAQAAAAATISARESLQLSMRVSRLEAAVAATAKTNPSAVPDPVREDGAAGSSAPAAEHDQEAAAAMAEFKRQLKALEDSGIPTTRTNSAAGSSGQLPSHLHSSHLPHPTPSGLGSPCLAPGNASSVLHSVNGLGRQRQEEANHHPFAEDDEASELPPARHFPSSRPGATFTESTSRRARGCVPGLGSAGPGNGSFGIAATSSSSFTGPGHNSNAGGGNALGRLGSDIQSAGPPLMSLISPLNSTIKYGTATPSDLKLAEQLRQGGGLRQGAMRAFV